MEIYKVNCGYDENDEDSAIVENVIEDKSQRFEVAKSKVISEEKSVNNSMEAIKIKDMKMDYGSMQDQM